DHCWKRGCYQGFFEFDLFQRSDIVKCVLGVVP
ncbi:hypothetical protein A2U01_0081970, partial [Trifolium medium]|nr:hypothetical protein [Trifolium medium]